MTLSTGDRVTLLDGASSSGSWVAWPGGRGHFQAFGTFGGSTVALEFSPDQSTALDLGSDAELTAAGVRVFELAPGFVRASITGGSGVSVDAQAVRF